MSLRLHARTVLLASTLLAPVLAAPLAARAADVPPIDQDGAAQLQAGLKAWLVGVLGPNVPLADKPITVAPEGDHYRLSVDVAGTYGDAVSVSADPLTALVKPLGGPRWSVDDLRMPSPLRVDNKTATGEQLKSMGVKIAEQNSHGIMDLSLASTTSFDSNVRDYTAVTTNAAGEQSTHVAHYTTHTTWEPAGDGRVNMLADGTADGITQASAMPDGTPVKFSADGIVVTAHADKVSFGKFGEAIKAVTDLIPLASLATDSNTGNVPVPARPAMRRLVTLLPDLMGGMEEQYSIKGMKLATGGYAGTLSNFTMGLGFGAPNGRMDIHMLVALDGLASPAIPPGAIAQLVPKHISVKPRVSGVPTNDAVQFLLHAIDSNGHDDDQLMAEAMGLLAKGPLQVSIDDLALDSGPATLHGVGAVNIASPADISGTAKLEVTGFDALIQQSNSDPMLAQGAPVLIFLKGIGRQDGNKMVWDIAYTGKKLTVNGTDMSSMIPSGGSN